MATHSSLLAWEIPRTEEPQWAIVHRVAKETRLNGLNKFIQLSALEIQDQNVYTHAPNVSKEKSLDEKLFSFIFSMGLFQMF